MRTRWGQSRTQWLTTTICLGFAQDDWALNDDHGAIQWTMSAVQCLSDSVKYLADFLTDDYNQSELMECLYWSSKVEPVDGFDMGILLGEMLTADPDELRFFIGLVDAYRQSLWNKPFNAEYFAAIAKGFE